MGLNIYAQGKWGQNNPFDVALSLDAILRLQGAKELARKRLEIHPDICIDATYELRKGVVGCSVRLIAPDNLSLEQGMRGLAEGVYRISMEIIGSTYFCREDSGLVKAIRSFLNGAGLAMTAQPLQQYAIANR